MSVCRGKTAIFASMVRLPFELRQGKPDKLLPLIDRRAVKSPHSKIAIWLYEH